MSCTLLHTHPQPEERRCQGALLGPVIVLLPGKTSWPTPSSVFRALSLQGQDFPQETGKLLSPSLALPLYTRDSHTGTESESWLCIELSPVSESSSLPGQLLASPRAWSTHTSAQA